MSAPRNAHSPKIGALQAYAEDLLSARGKARIEEHLAGCERCRRALAAIDLYRRSAAEIREAPAPELDWSRMNLALAREAKQIAEQQAQRARAVPREAMIAIGIAAAAILGLLAWPKEAHAPIAEEHETAPTESPIEPVLEPAPVVLASVTLVSGRARAAERSLEVGSDLVSGETIATEPGSALHAALADGSGFALAAATEIALGADGAAIEIALRRGSLVAAVDPARIASGSRFLVLAAEHRLEAHGTRFEVMLEAGVVRLGVAEGEVAVHAPDGTVTIVRAPDSWSSAGGEGETAPIAAPYALGAEARAWPVVSVAREGIVRWEIGEYAVEGIGTLSMRAPPGELAVAGFDANGHAFRTVAIVGANGLTIAGEALVPEPPRVRQGTLDVEREVWPVIRSGARRLQQCYEGALRRSEPLEVRVNVEITVAYDGSVSRIRALDEVPPALDECLQTHIARWIFPPPHGNGSFRFRAPFDFRAR